MNENFSQSRKKESRSLSSQIKDGEIQCLRRRTKTNYSNNLDHQHEKKEGKKLSPLKLEPTRQSSLNKEKLTLKYHSIPCLELRRPPLRIEERKREIGSSNKLENQFKYYELLQAKANPEVLFVQNQRFQFNQIEKKEIINDDKLEKFKRCIGRIDQKGILWENKTLLSYIGNRRQWGIQRKKRNYDSEKIMVICINNGKYIHFRNEEKGRRILDDLKYYKLILNDYSVLERQNVFIVMCYDWEDKTKSFAQIHDIFLWIGIPSYHDFEKELIYQIIPSFFNRLFQAKNYYKEDFSLKTISFRRKEGYIMISDNKSKNDKQSFNKCNIIQDAKVKKKMFFYRQ